MKTQNTEKVLVYVRVKPYVYKFFMKIFHNSRNTAIKLPNSDLIYREIWNRLHKPRNWRIARIDEKKMQSARLAIELQDVDVKIQGYDLSLNDERNVSSLMEDNVHKAMLMWVSLRYLMGCPLHATIEKWMKEYDLNDEDWNVESIRRMCTRAGIYKAKKEYIDFVSDKIAAIVGRNMSS